MDPVTLIQFLFQFYFRYVVVKNSGFNAFYFFKRFIIILYLLLFKKDL